MADDPKPPGEDGNPPDDASPPDAPEGTEGSRASERDHVNPSDMKRGPGWKELDQLWGAHLEDKAEDDITHRRNEADRSFAANREWKARRAAAADEAAETAEQEETAPKANRLGPAPLGCSPMLLLGALLIAIVPLGLWQFGGSDDDPPGVAVGDAAGVAVDDGNSPDTDDADTEDGAGATTEDEVETVTEDEPVAVTDESVPHPLAQIKSVGAVVDENGDVWIQITFEEGWARIPPDGFFSLFWDVFVSFNPTVEVGWQVHAGAATILGTTSEAYILDDGTVLVATGLAPVRPFELTIEASFGSWGDEAGPPAVFGEVSLSVGSDSIEDGDPFVAFGQPVYDLVTATEVAAG